MAWISDVSGLEWGWNSDRYLLLFFIQTERYKLTDLHFKNKVRMI